MQPHPKQHTRLGAETPTGPHHLGLGGLESVGNFLKFVIFSSEVVSSTGMRHCNSTSRLSICSHVSHMRDKYHDSKEINDTFSYVLCSTRPLTSPGKTNVSGWIAQLGPSYPDGHVSIGRPGLGGGMGSDPRPWLNPPNSFHALFGNSEKKVAS